MEKKIKVLQLLGGGNAIGGVEQMLLNYYSFIDRNKIVFDFCFYRKSTYDTVNAYSDVLADSKIINLNAFDTNSNLWDYIKTVSKVKRLIKDNNYDIVHINAGRPPLLVFGLLSACLAKVKVKITHSHSTRGKIEHFSIKDIIYYFSSVCIRFFLRKYSTYLFSCSTEAGKYMYGNNIVEQINYVPIHNAVNIELYRFNEKKRYNIRSQYNIPKDVTLFGHVGRFSKEKNQLFLIDVFYEIHKKNSRTMLWLIGDGDETLKQEIKQKIIKYGIDDVVILMGSRQDVCDLDQALDAMIFPSLYEGLSVVLIEAQCASLPVFASDSISSEHKVTDLINFISLDKDKVYWSEYILEKMKDKTIRIDSTELITKNGYNISIEANKLQSLYIKALSK